MLGLVGGAISRAIKNLTNKASKSSSSSKSSNNKSSSSNRGSSSSRNSSSSSSNNYGSGSSYAYDPSGNKVNVSIKNGQSYLDNGQRVGAGYTVQTGGGIYKMGNDGKGYKVDSHNVYSSNNSSRNSSSSNSGLDARSKGISLTPFTDYSNQYNDALLNIYEKNKVDNSVLRNMFTSDILNRNNTDPDYQRYGDFEITDEMISGYNNAYDENMRQLTTKYNNFDDNKKNSREGQLYLDAINRYQTGGSSGNPNFNADVLASYNADPYQENMSGEAYYPMGYDMPVNNYYVNNGVNPEAFYDFANQTGEMINNIGRVTGQSISDLANTIQGLKPIARGNNNEEFYKVGNGLYAVKTGNGLVEINENEYINYMSQLTGF